MQNVPIFRTRRGTIRMLCIGILADAVCAILLTSIAAAADVDYYRDVYPILKSNCVSCHNTTTTEGGLNLESPQVLRTGGDSGPGVVPGKSADSLIYQSAAHIGDVIMPPPSNGVGAKKLTTEELAVLGAWINGGAKDSVRQVQNLAWRAPVANVSPIYAVEVSPDGRWGIAGHANQISLFDLESRQFISRISDPALTQQQATATASPSHLGPVTALAFSPDGKRFASGSFREVKIWQQQSPTSGWTPLKSGSEVIATAQIPGQQLLTADSNGQLTVIERETSAQLKSIATSIKQVSSLSVSPDGRLVAISSAEPVISVWDLTTAALHATIPTPSVSSGLTWVSAKSLIIAGADPVLRRADLPEAASTEPVALKDFATAPAKIRAVQSLKQPERVACVLENGQVALWTLADGKALSVLKFPGAVSLSCSDNGTLLAAGCENGSVHLWDLAAGKALWERNDSLSRANQVRVTKHRLAVAQLDLAFQKSEVTRLTAANKSLDEVLKKANETITTASKVLPDRKKAFETEEAARAAAQKTVDDLQSRIMMSEGMKNPELEKQLATAQQALTAATTKADEAKKMLQTSEHHHNDAQEEIAIATAAKDRNTEQLKAAEAASVEAQKQSDSFTAESKTLQQPLEKSGPVTSVAIDPEQQVVAAVNAEGAVRVWAVATGNPIAELPAGDKSGTAQVSSGKGVVVATMSNGASVQIQTRPTWIVERVLGGDAAPETFADRVNALRFSPDGSLLAIGGGEPSRSGEISLWKVDSGELVTRWTDRHKDTVLSLDFLPDGSAIASGAADQLVKVTEVATGKHLHLFEGHTHHALGVCFRADGRFLASAGGDNIVLIWDMQRGERSRKVAGWIKEVTAVRFLGGTTTYVTSAGDNQARVLNEAGGQVRAIAGLPDFLHCVACPLDGSFFIAGGEDGVLRMWKTEDGKELASFPIK